MKEYKAYNYKHKTMLIERYLLLGEQYCHPKEYNRFDRKLCLFASEKITDVVENGYGKYKLFSEQNHEFFNSFQNYPFPDDKKIFLYAEVFSETKTKVIVNVMCGKSSKLWVNGESISIHQQDWVTQYYVTVYLNKGKNIFLLENYSPKKSNLFSIQLRNYKFEMSDDFQALSRLGNRVQINPLILVSDPAYNIKDSKFKFMYMNNDKRKYNEVYKIDIYDSKIGFVESLTGTISKVTEIDIGKLRALDEETLRHQWISCTFRERNQEELTTSIYLFLYNIENERLGVNNKALTGLGKLSKEIQEGILGRLRLQELSLRTNDKISLYWYTYQLKNILSWVEEGIYPYGYYKGPGVQEIYMHSNLDNSIIRLTANIPKNYDESKGYPLILALATGSEGGFCWGPIEENLEEACLCFDVTGRGFCGGSYVGEASTFEILEWIKSNYKIDENRIYMLGQSNGGYATYSIAQNHPHLAAAIFPQIGNPCMTTIKNLLNTPTYQMVSSKDHAFIGHENEVKKAINKYGNYHQYDFSEMTHHNLTPYLYHKDVLNSMLRAKRNLYPNRIIFSTVRNRHLESFWVCLHGIAKSKKAAYVKAEILNKNYIKINTKGTDGITVTIPPQVDCEDFIIGINNKDFVFSKIENRKLFFIKNKSWTVALNEPPVDLRKGTGLLDVYLNSMRIILPSGENDTFGKFAEAFAHPHTNGLNPALYTDYPIYLDDDIPEHILSHNLILFDRAESNIFVKRFKNKLIVRYDDRGYEYKGTRTETDYVLMQVIPNPYNAFLSILVISTNKEELLSKNLFVRKVIIPFYANGLHPYLNNQVLIFDGQKYFRIYEADGEIEEVY